MTQSGHSELGDLCWTQQSLRFGSHSPHSEYYCPLGQLIVGSICLLIAALGVLARRKH
jgi:hypothetical protein